MKSLLLIFAICTFSARASAADTEPITIEQWKKRLAGPKYKIGKSRSDVEKQLARPIVGEFTTDHGFDHLRDVYYQLDTRYLTKIAYSRHGDRNSMKVVVSPNVYRIDADLLNWLKAQKDSVQIQRRTNSPAP